MSLHYRVLRHIWLALLLLACLPAHAGAGDSLLNEGQRLRQRGDFNGAIAILARAREAASDPESAQRAAILLGATRLQAGRPAEAEEPLLAAYRNSSGPMRAAAALELGNLALLRKQADRAQGLYREASQLVGAGSLTGLGARLNLVRLLPPAERLAALGVVLSDVIALPDAGARAELLLQVGYQAAEAGVAGRGLAYRSLDVALRLTGGETAGRMHIAALEALSRLYEEEGRLDEVIALGEGAREAAGQGAVGLFRDLLLAIEWRLGRAYRKIGRTDLALAAYARAVEQAQVIRPDLPIESQGGRSTYDSLLKPLLEGYVDLQLDALEGLPAGRRASALAQVRETVESLRQAEMQDFLGDRCTVEEAEAARLEAGVMALYPILLPGRLEILVETRDGLRRTRFAVPREEVANSTRALALAIRNGDEDYLPLARRLYDWLIRPIELQMESIHTLVVVPDGALRLIPFAVLNDGKAPLIERVAVSTVTGLSMTHGGALPKGEIVSLLAGIAEPGPVVDRIPDTEIVRAAAGISRGATVGRLAKGRFMRSASRGLTDRAAEALRKALALPGVREEVRSLARILPGQVLLDADFTLRNFQHEAERGEYRIVHIASHGVFGGTAETSFILAYDELLGINRLQSVLRSERVLQTPIELLTLSACETAEGNDRAPLGIAGAAIRARARSVLGTLWPVEDEVAKRLMVDFYRGITDRRLSKARALREAQLRLMGDAATRHPLFWAPFNLVGNWR